jgi:hypothetical protein
MPHLARIVKEAKSLGMRPGNRDDNLGGRNASHLIWQIDINRCADNWVPAGIPANQSRQGNDF